MAPPTRTSIARKEPPPSATLQRFRQGDGAAFLEIMQQYQPLVRAAAARCFRGEFEREEAMQEIWLHIFRQRETLDLDRREAFSGWLAVLARRRCVDLLRRAADPSEDSEESALQWLADPPEQEEAAEYADLLRAVESFRARLKPLWQKFFDAYFVEGLDYEQVGRRLAIGKLRCKYMRKVIALRARRSHALMSALGRRAGGPAE